MLGSIDDYNTVDGILDEIFEFNDYTDKNALGIIKESLGIQRDIDENVSVFDSQEVIDEFEKLYNNFDSYDDDSLYDEIIRIRDEVAPCSCDECVKNIEISKRIYGDRE